MPPEDPNLPQLRTIAAALGPELCAEFVFVGGATAGLLLTDPAAAAVRTTLDVDAVVAADSLSQFYDIERRLEARGFMRSPQDDVICRWRHAASGLSFDLMPVAGHILGFTNPWYDEAVRTATRIGIGHGLDIRCVSAPAFVATKLAAYLDRGRRDFLASHDLEDVLNLVDGRAQLADELAGASAALRAMVSQTLTELLAHPDFANVLPGLLAEPERVGLVLERLRRMC